MKSKIVKPIKAETNRRPDGTFGVGNNANPTGRPPGLSLLSDIKLKLEKVRKEDPDEYERLIDDYWQDRKKRDLLIKMIDGMPKQQMEHSGEINLPTPIYNGKSKE